LPCIEIDFQLPTKVSISLSLLSQEFGPDQSIHKQATNQISRDISSVLQLFAFQAHPRTWRLAFYVRRPPPLVCSGFLYLECCGERPSWSPLWVFRVMYLITAGYITLACKRTARSGADSKVDHVSRRQRLSRGRTERRLRPAWYFMVSPGRSMLGVVRLSRLCFRLGRGRVGSHR
jgi:hypothetical protein